MFTNIDSTVRETSRRWSPGLRAENEHQGAGLGWALGRVLQGGVRVGTPMPKIRCADGSITASGPEVGIQGVCGRGRGNVTLYLH